MENDKEDIDIRYYFCIQGVLGLLEEIITLKL